jgi:hypothetical protein
VLRQGLDQFREQGLRRLVLQGWQLPVREHAACISQNAVHGFYL